MKKMLLSRGKKSLPKTPQNSKGEKSSKKYEKIFA